MKRYVHPIVHYLSSEFSHNEGGVNLYRITFTPEKGEKSVLKSGEKGLFVGEATLDALGFIEKEEEPDTKWIDDVYKDLENDENSKGLCPGEQYYFLEIETLKKAILSHLPSRT